jgi:hypothetical protein
MSGANPTTIPFFLAASNASGVSLSQTLASAAALSLNGTLVSGSIATFAQACRVAITSAGNDSSITWSIVGTDRYGNPQTETSLTGGNSATSYTQRDFLTVSAITSSGATASGVQAGTNGVGSTPWFIKEFGSVGTLGVAILMATGSNATGTFEITMDDPNAAQAAGLLPYQPSVEPQSNVPPQPWAVPGLTNISGSYGPAQVSVPMFAWRWTNYSGTSSTIVQVIETTWLQEGKSG